MVIKRSTRVIFIKAKKLFGVYDIEVDKTLISKKGSYGRKNSFKYFLGYDDDDDVIRHLCIKLPQIIGCAKHSDSNNIF